MSTVARSGLDPVESQVLLTRMQAVADEAFRSIEHTAVSPTVAEALDGSCALLDAHGRLVVGGGHMDTQPYSASVAVRAIMARHGDTICAGDVFIGNDPHADCSLHPQDVVVAKPVFVDGVLSAWVANVAHMTDMGGMRFGSWAPDATECYQEALRLPPIRIFAAGVEQRDVWDVIRTNVRLSNLVEMDLRSLVAGCHVAESKLTALIQSNGGPKRFLRIVDSVHTRVTEEMRRRITAIEDGIYRAVSWTEWDTEFYRIPCTLTVDGSTMRFDFEGASPQCNHLFNSRPWIVKAVLVPNLWYYLAPDLPLTDALFEIFDIKCPEGSVLNSRPPAPIASAHVDASGIAADVGITCLVLALGCSSRTQAPRLTAQLTEAGSAVHTWRFTGFDGNADGCLALDGSCSGSPAGEEVDGVDFLPFRVRGRGRMELVDIEVLESWYPMLVVQKRPRPGAWGAGRMRGGAGCQMRVRPHGTQQLVGSMLGRREHLPFQGIAGGMPGGPMQFRLHRADGVVQPVGAHDADVVVKEGDVFEFRASSGGGFGDPLDREPQLVLDDLLEDRLVAEEAAAVYGVILDARGYVDLEATDSERERLRRERLARARPAKHPLDAVVEARDDRTWPLYPGIVQRGAYAVADASGAPLGVAPGPWWDGCPVVTERWMTRSGSDVMVETYLDPRTGRALMVDARLDCEERSFDVLPRRWTEACLG